MYFEEDDMFDEIVNPTKPDLTPEEIAAIVAAIQLRASTDVKGFDEDAAYAFLNQADADRSDLLDIITQLQRQIIEREAMQCECGVDDACKLLVRAETAEKQLASSEQIRTAEKKILIEEIEAHAETKRQLAEIIARECPVPQLSKREEKFIGVLREHWHTLSQTTKDLISTLDRITGTGGQK